jgi:uncharacterized protein
MQLSRYLKIYPCLETPGRNLLYSTRHGATVIITDETLGAATTGTLAGPDSDTLARLGILVPDRAAERDELRDIFLTANRSRPLFQGIVVLNLDCNLACTYCFEGNFRGGEYMSHVTADLVVESIRRDQIGAGRDVILTFYGGEPLLSVPLIREIAGRLKEAAAGRGTGFAFNLVTNGTLLSRTVARELIPLGLNGAKFTLDGPRELHDLSRPFVSGLGSFDAIVRNIGEVCDLVPLQLGGNFTRHNFRKFPALLDHLLAEGITPEKLTRVLFTPVVPKAGRKGAADFNGGCVCDYEPWLTEATLFLREEVLARGFSAPRPRLFSCMVELESDLVINWDGALYKCPAFMGCDDLRIGVLGGGINDYRLSHNMDLWKNDECLDCAYLPLCFGGCRQMTLLRNGEINEVDCRKGFFDAALERIIRQDLKYQRGKKG